MRFCTLLTFLVPDGQILPNACSRRDAKNLSLPDGLFLTLCRLWQNFALKDLFMWFELSLQSSGEIFSAWIDHMYYKLSQVPIWPNRQNIINQMPSEYKRDFPNSMIILDGIEIRVCFLSLAQSKLRLCSANHRPGYWSNLACDWPSTAWAYSEQETENGPWTQTPSALTVQSQFYSDYKSSTTSKSLVGCIHQIGRFVSYQNYLYTGSIHETTSCSIQAAKQGRELHKYIFVLFSVK